MPDAALNIAIAFPSLQREVRTTLRVHSGNPNALKLQKRQVLDFLSTLNQQTSAIPNVDLAIYRREITSILDQLDRAHHISNDLPDAPAYRPSSLVRTGKRGRPRMEIDPNWLAWANKQRSNPGLAPLVEASSRTVRRRLVEYGIRPAGQPVFVSVMGVDGTSSKVYNSSNSRRQSALTPTGAILTDGELDALIADRLNKFPNFGRAMLLGSFTHDGFHITRARIIASYNRVHGATRSFGVRRLHRRAYQVAGPNSLWHHDGQHGLIRFKIVIHCFIDGFSRFVVGIKVGSNNRGQTVLDLFNSSRMHFGTPSRVRGDHGVENILVAALMEDLRGPDRGSYIWGRSVHNTRIERLWYDVTSGFGLKWKEFFLDLEHHHDLNPLLSEHIWLLHFLFLSSINQDAQDWAAAWNSHKMQIKGERSRSPNDMYGFGMMQRGARGLALRPAPEDEDIGNINQYGVDDTVHRDARLMRHFHANNPDEDPEAPFQLPEHIARVECEPPNCPFNTDQMIFFRDQVAHRAGHLLHAIDMPSRRQVWIVAFRISAELSAQVFLSPGNLY